MPEERNIAVLHSLLVNHLMVALFFATLGTYLAFELIVTLLQLLKR